MPSQKSRKRRQQQQRAKQQKQQHQQSVSAEEPPQDREAKEDISELPPEVEAKKDIHGPRPEEVVAITKQEEDSSEVSERHSKALRGEPEQDVPLQERRLEEEPPEKEASETQAKGPSRLVQKSREVAVVAMEESKQNKQTEKTKEEVMAEREAKKAEKAARRAAAKQQQQDQKETTTKGKQQQNDTPKADQRAPKQQAHHVDEHKGQQQPHQQEKSKAQLRAERRAKQEAQRAAKEAAAAVAGGSVAGQKQQPQQQQQHQQQQPTTASKVAKSSGGASQRVPDDMQADRASVEKKLQKKLASARIPPRTKAQRKVMLFSHLHQYERELSIGRHLPAVGGAVHPAVVEVGLKFAEGTVTGSNARCVALLAALKKVIRDYSTPPQKELARDLDARLRPQLTFLRQCRPLSVSMGNAVRFIKTRINSLSPDMPDAEAKALLCKAADDFVYENILLAAKQISDTACTKIRDGDVILTYGCSSLLRSVLVEAARRSRARGGGGDRSGGECGFRVVVADGRPRREGREMARALAAAGVRVDSYAQVSALPYLMPEVTKAMLGAHAVLANGAVMGRVGTSQVALIAKAFHVPVLVCCETYKFSERVQTDSFVFNELGDPDDLVSLSPDSYPVAPLADWRDHRALCLLNLAYDITPASLVDAIISEISVIPTTSVPVVLRLKSMEVGGSGAGAH